ncbi:synaptotagmin-7 isoform X3 [Tribolium madens]|uniref:synaptotagmin-7 isoform X3 n=1 Tax=Tribolium madens TaxID=41895 RepID=UPI001CF71E00|nr:synaptotagmin-7 isoform X3 [Tribolium madens]
MLSAIFLIHGVLGRPATQQDSHQIPVAISRVVNEVLIASWPIFTTTCVPSYSKNSSCETAASRRPLYPVKTCVATLAAASVVHPGFSGNVQVCAPVWLVRLLYKMYYFMTGVVQNCEQILRAQLETTGSPQAKSPAGSSAGALPSEARTPTAPNKALQNVKGDHPSVSQDMAFLQNRSISLVDMYIDNSEPSENVGQIHFSLEYDFQNTTLILRIIQGKDLPAKDLSGTSDPYVRVTLLPDKKHRLETKIKRRTLNPRWNETFYFEGFPIQKLQSRVLHLHVFDYDRFSRDDSIGEVFLPLCQVDLSEKPSFWKALKPPAKDKCGELLTSLCYHPSNSILTLTLLKARNLKAKDINGKSDPYVKVWLQFGDKRIEKRKTAIYKCTLNPVFNDTFSFNVPWEKIRECSLDVMVMDFDNIGRNELIGRILLAGKNGSGASETKHWQDMITKPRQTIVQWHRLKPE